MQEIRQSVYKAVTSSCEYVELRERYRRLLIEFREMTEELDRAERQARNRSLENTFLTVSEEEGVPE